MVPWPDGDMKRDAPALDREQDRQVGFCFEIGIILFVLVGIAMQFYKPVRIGSSVVLVADQSPVQSLRRGQQVTHGQ